MIRILLATFLLALPLPAAAAGPPACQGRSLIDVAAVEQPRELAEARKAAAAIPNGDRLLWRIEGKEGGKPSWLFGTIHLTDDRVRIPPPSAAAALAGASTLAVEVVEASDPTQLAALFGANPRLVALPDSKTIWELLGADGSRRLRERLRAAGGDPARAARLQPWLVATSFSIPACEATRVAHGLKRLDDALIEEAKARGIEVVGLERIEEQIEAMAAMPLDGQAGQLLVLLDAKVTAEDRQETLVRLYLDRQLAIIFPLMEMALIENPKLAASFRHFSETLIRKRNHIMAARARPLIERGGVFIAVGAAHLPGEEGLVELIRRAAYEVVPVD